MLAETATRYIPGTKQEIANIPLDKLVPAARFTLASQDHVFRIGGKTIIMSDLHLCNATQVGLANFLRLEVEQAPKPNNHPSRR